VSQVTAVTGGDDMHTSGRTGAARDGMTKESVEIDFWR
jgi:hypothetical protein